MAVPGSLSSHHCICRSIEVFHLLRSVARRAIGKANTDQRFSADRTAKLDEFLKTRARRLQAAPGAERFSLVRVADGIFPFELAEPRFIKSAPTEADNPRLQSSDGLDHIRSPATNCLDRHQGGVVNPEGSWPAKFDRESGIRVIACGPESMSEFLPLAPRSKRAGSINLPFAAEFDLD